MKIAELQLIAFGPFTDCQLDLSAGSHGLHILYGPNEAGKSSSLRAITHFLYGFPASTPDDFQHPYKLLRVGARLEHSDGTQLTTVRRKAQKLSLRCDQDQEPIAEDTLLHFMGDVDQEFFKSMFGINHHRLREGGKDIAAGKGRLGELLFAAGAGVVNLQQLQNDLQTEADALLKSTLRSGSIQQHLQDYLERRKAVGAAQETVDTWKNCEQQCQLQRQRKAELDQQLNQTHCELTRLQRIESASAPIDRWKTRKQKLQLLSHVPHLEDDFARRTNELLLELKTGQMQTSGATAELAKIAAQLESMIVPQAILAAYEAIEALRDRVGGIRKSLVDRPAVEARCRDCESEAQELMRELDRSPDLSTIEELRLPRDKTVKIRSLGTQLQRQFERLQAQRKNCEQLQLNISSSEQRLAVQPVACDLTALRASLRAIQLQGDVQTELIQAEADRAKLQHQVELALKKLPLFTGQLTELECLPLPSPV
ncbi:MAG: AAA family ATPase, partial [Planctomycetales bacterium]|nr:AAA family ATPase [Planctomycetales bacterium]